MKARRNSNKPVIILSYMITRPSIGELPDFIDTAVDLGANEVVAINLDYTIGSAQAALQAFSCSQPPPEYEALLGEAARRAAKQGLVFRTYPLSKGEPTLVCDARPLDTVFINHRGEVGPCTYLGMGVRGEIPRLFCGQPHPTTPVSYGHVAGGLPDVWQGPAARAFKEPFANRRRLSNPAVTLLSVADRTQPEAPPPPPQCVHCYKLYKL